MFVFLSCFRNYRPISEWKTTPPCTQTGNYCDVRHNTGVFPVADKTNQIISDKTPTASTRRVSRLILGSSFYTLCLFQTTTENSVRQLTVPDLASWRFSFCVRRENYPTWQENPNKTNWHQTPKPSRTYITRGFALFSLDWRPGLGTKKEEEKKKAVVFCFSLCVLWETNEKKIRTDLCLSTVSENSGNSLARNSSGPPASERGLCCMIVFEG